MNNTRIYKCNHCGIEETDENRMQKCTGCNSSRILYCSRECQKLAWSSHKNRCRRKSNKASKLILNENIQNFDLVLSYASRYMKNLKYVNFTLWDLHCNVGHIVLSAGALQSFLQSNGGKLDKLVWTIDSDIVSFARIDKETNGGKVWTELHDLKLLRIMNPLFNSVQDLLQVIKQQEESIQSLSLISMVSGRPQPVSASVLWPRNDWKSVATSIGKCKKLVNLNLNQHSLRDADLEILLPGLPCLQILNLQVDRSLVNTVGHLGNKSCKTISRSCLAPHDMVIYNAFIEISGGRIVPFNEVLGFVDPASLSTALANDVLTVYRQNLEQVKKRMRLAVTRQDLVNAWDEL